MDQASPLDPLERVYSSIGLSEDMLQSIVAGGCAGILAKTVIAPAERVKMTFQTTKEVFTLGGALAKGQNMVKKGGVLSLWRGHSSTIVRVAPYAGLSYAFHDLAETELKKYHGTEKLPTYLQFTAGSFGGAVATALTYPLDVVRVRLALIPGSSWGTVLRQGHFYQGLQPTMIGIIAYAGVCWSVKQELLVGYQHWRGVGPGDEELKPAVYESLLMNGIAGLSSQFVTYPLDVARRRMQLTAGVEGNTFSVLAHLYRTEGLRGLTKGYSLNIIKGPLTLSISLTAYDRLRDWLRIRGKGRRGGNAPVK
jgi:solute carrier family 25 protein 42